MNELFLIASLDGHDIAIDADQIESVIDVSELVPVPRSEPAIRGLAALRSRVVTVIDTRRLLGLSPMPADAVRAVTTEVDGHLYAFLVDELDDVAPFARQPLASGVALGKAWRTAASATIDRHGELLPIVDLAVLVRGTPALAA